MSFDNPQAPTFCPTCESELPPKTEIQYFAQGPRCPEQYDLDFGAELLLLLYHISALFDAVGRREHGGGH